MHFSERTQNLLRQLYKGREHVSLTVGLLDNNKIQTVHFDENKRADHEKLIYPVGSIGKVFTASLLAKHISEGRISLEDSLSAYVEDLPEQYYPTIKRLATHHSGYGGAPFGLPEMLLKLLLMNRENGIMHVNPFRGYPDEQDMKKIISEMHLEDKDYKFSYSNLAFGILGYILGKLEGTDFFTAMEGFAKELGLSDTSLSNSCMTGYDKKGNPCMPWQWESTDIIAPAGALLSSMEDLLKFASLVMDGSHPYLSMCLDNYASGEKTFDQGLAWRLKKESSIAYHVGNAGAFTCILAIDTQKKRAAAIGLNHAMVDVEELAFSLLED